MVIYVDLLFLINFIFDYFLLLTVNIALKRYAKLRRLFLASLIGSITLISLFLPLNGLLLILLKLILGLIMVISAFGYKNIKYTFYNLLYLYLVSIILGGFLYYLKTEVSTNHQGLKFYYKGLGFSYLIILFMAPLILILFLKSLKVLKEIKNYYYQIKIVLNNNLIIEIPAFLDTGNKLKDPITNKYIILINKKVLKGKFNIRSPMYVFYNTISNHGVLECFKPQKIYINNQELSNYLIGLVDKSFKLNGIECLLNYHVWEDLND